MKIQMSRTPFWGVDNKVVDVLEKHGVEFSDFLYIGGVQRVAKTNGWVDDDLTTIISFIKATGNYAYMGVYGDDICLLVGDRYNGWVN